MTKFSIKDLFHKRSPRSQKAIIHITISFFSKGISIIISFIMVPLILGYLDKERYGIWLILSSISVWLNFFDIGIGNGLRNKFAEAKARSDMNLARQYVSTTYAIIALIFVSLLIIFNIINPFINWQLVFNTTLIPNHELKIFTHIAISFFLIQFILKQIGIILMADQRPGISSLFGPIGNIILILTLYIIMKFSTHGSIIILGTLMSGIPILVLIVVSIYFFSTDYKSIRPRITDINMIHAKELMNLGVKFFMIQVGGLILFSSSNIIITQLFNPSEVTIYNIGYKYFYSLIMLNSLIMTPFWSAFTDAYTKDDINWIKNVFKKLNLLSFVFMLIAIFAFFISDWVYGVWVGKNIEIPRSLSFGLAVFVIITVIVTPYTNFIAGVGKLSLGIRILLFKTILFVPLSLLLCKTSLGISGVIFSTIITQSISLFFEPMQTYLIINRKATGIWNK